MSPTAGQPRQEPTRTPESVEKADEAQAAENAAPAPLLTLREGLPEVITTEPALQELAERIASGTGPVALDAERASGYRYSARAYLIQLRREGAGSALVDPIAFTDLRVLDEAIGEAEWVLHAATQDLGCLREVGLVPRALFDTELAARLLGYPRVGLATLVETVLGFRMRKEHSAVDWSTRPLPEPWLEYAALDVEVLVTLRDRLAAELAETGKEEWARQEFEALLSFEPPAREEPWRRTSGMHKVKGRRPLAAVRELWETRDRIAEARDVSPGKLIPDSAIVAAARAMPGSARALMETPGFHGRGAKRYRTDWYAALDRARTLPEQQLPAMTRRNGGPPQPRAWAERDPLAAARLTAARAAVQALAEERGLPVENLLTPDYLRRVIWSPPATEGGMDDVREAVAGALSELGARPWQVELTAGLLAEAILHPAWPEGS